MGRQALAEPLLHVFWLKDHIPADHSPEQVDKLLDLGFVREGMAKHYSPLGALD